MRLIAAVSALAIAVVLLVVVFCVSPWSGSHCYRVLKYASKSGDMYCVSVVPGRDVFLMEITVVKPVEIMYVNPTQLFATIKLVAKSVDGRYASGINIVVLRQGLWNVYVESSVPGTYCFRIVPLG